MKTFYSINGRPVQDSEFAPFAASAMALMQDRLRDVEAERDYLAAMLDRVWALCKEWESGENSVTDVEPGIAYCASTLMVALDAPTTGDDQ